MYLEYTIRPCKGFKDQRICHIINNQFGYLPTVHTRLYNIFTQSRILDTSKRNKTNNICIYHCDCRLKTYNNPNIKLVFN